VKLSEQVYEGVISDVAGEKTAMLQWRGEIRGFFGPVRHWFKCPEIKTPFDHLHKKVRLRMVLETIE
jgi:hypothetical protein